MSRDNDLERMYRYKERELYIMSSIVFLIDRWHKNNYRSIEELINYDRDKVRYGKWIS